MNFDDPTVLGVYLEITNRGISAEWLAKKIGINRSTIYKRMNRPETFKLDELRAISKVLRIDIGELVRGRR